MLDLNPIKWFRIMPSIHLRGTYIACSNKGHLWHNRKFELVTIKSRSFCDFKSEEINFFCFVLRDRPLLTERERFVLTCENFWDNSISMFRIRAAINCHCLIFDNEIGIKDIKDRERVNQMFSLFLYFDAFQLGSLDNYNSRKCQM